MRCCLVFGCIVESTAIESLHKKWFTSDRNIYERGPQPPVHCLVLGRNPFRTKPQKWRVSAHMCDACKAVFVKAGHMCKTISSPHPLLLPPPPVRQITLIDEIQLAVSTAIPGNAWSPQIQEGLCPCTIHILLLSDRKGSFSLSIADRFSLSSTVWHNSPTSKIISLWKPSPSV